MVEEIPFFIRSFLYEDFVSIPNVFLNFNKVYFLVNGMYSEICVCFKYYFADGSCLVIAYFTHKISQL